LREPAHGLRERPRAMARRGRRLPDPGISAPLGLCTHICMGARRDRFSTIAKRGRRCVREPAHGLGEWPRAMARRGRRLPDLSISTPSVVARILVWARDATDFGPSINGGATGGRAQLASVSASDGAPALAVFRPCDSAHTDGLHTYILVRCDRRDRFSTIEKRRCDCAGGRAKAASVLASDGAPAQAVCPPCDPAHPYACTPMDEG
jgi:hypothetical protein